MKLLLALLLAAGLSGCIIHSHGHGPGVKIKGPPPGHMKVVIPAGHVHDAHCGHYCCGGVWYHHPGHVHGHGCGHVLRGGIWILE